jgi:hypothetical protein
LDRRSCQFSAGHCEFLIPAATVLIYGDQHLSATKVEFEVGFVATLKQ